MNNQVYNSSSSFSNNINAVLIWFIALCSIRFYDFVPETFGKAVILLADLLIFTFLFLYIVYGQGKSVKRHFSTEVLIMFSSLIISSFAALLFHEQPLLITFYAQFPLYTLFFYFLLSNIQPDPEKIIKMFIWLGYFYAIIYFVQYLIYPTQLVTSKVLIDRGSVRIGMPGAEYMIVSWFVLLTKYFNTKKIINIVGLIPFIVIIIILATRQLLASMMLVSIIYILFTKQLKSKFSVFFMIALAIIPFYFLFQDIIMEMISVSKDQKAAAGENIRLLSARFFLFDLNHNPLWIITGNGFPGPHTQYGVYIDRMSKELGYYMSDIGLIGDFAKFGIFYAIAVISLLIRMIYFKHNKESMFIRYTALAIVLTLFTGPGFSASLIIELSFFFYIIDHQIKSAEDSKHDFANNNSATDPVIARDGIQTI